MKQVLETGKRYSLYRTDGTERVFNFKEVIGQGASCIVYDGYYCDKYAIRHSVRIKECYPERFAEQRREGNRVCWKNEESKSEAFADWERAYRIQLAIQEESELVNTASKLTDEMYQGNNTLYMVMEVDNGKTFKPENLENIYQILCVVDALADVVKNYHQAGYLHLDIKPQNFLVLSGKNVRVKLFDFDSLTSIDEIQDGIAQRISYSEEWAAPEVKQGRIDKISEAADVYSIGMILYAALFGHTIRAEEQILTDGFDLDGCKWLVGVNPRLIPKLERFLKKALSLSIIKRYQTISQMSQDLEELLVLADPKRMYLCSNIPKQLRCFIGRKKELNQIQEELERNPVVLLQGIGGIGKSELSKKYAYEFQKKYSNVVWMNCQGSLEETIKRDEVLTIANCSQNWMRYEEKLTVLKTLVDKDTLFVLDDIRDFTEPALLDLLEMNCRFLITSRNYFTDLKEQFFIMTLDCMETQELEELFYSEYDRSMGEEEKEIVPELISRMGNLTLLIPLLAKQMKSSAIFPSEMLSRLQKEGLRVNVRESILHKKDEEVIRKDFYGMLRYFLNLSDLQPEEKLVLKVMSYFEPMYVGRKELAKWCGLADDETGIGNLEPINQLVQKGWLFWDEELDRISIHKVIRDMAVAEYRPYINELPSMKERIARLLREMKWEANVPREGIYKEWLEDAIERRITVSYYDVLQSLSLILHMFGNQSLDTAEILRYMIWVSGEIYLHTASASITELMEKVVAEAEQRKLLTEDEKAAAYLVMIRNERMLGLQKNIDYQKALQHLNRALEDGKTVKNWKRFKSYDDYCRKLCEIDPMDDYYLITTDSTTAERKPYYDKMASVLEDIKETENVTEEERKYAWSIGTGNPYGLELDDSLEEALERMREEEIALLGYHVKVRAAHMLGVACRQEWSYTEYLEEHGYFLLWAFENVVKEIREGKMDVSQVEGMMQRLEKKRREELALVLFLIVQDMELLHVKQHKVAVCRFLECTLRCSAAIGCKEIYGEAELLRQKWSSIDVSGEKKNDIREEVSKAQIRKIGEYAHQIVKLSTNKDEFLKQLKQETEIPESYRRFLVSALENNQTHLLDIGLSGREIPDVCWADEQAWEFIENHRRCPNVNLENLVQKIDFWGEICFQCALCYISGKDCMEQMWDYLDEYLALTKEIEMQEKPKPYIQRYSLLPEILYLIGRTQEAEKIYQAMEVWGVSNPFLQNKKEAVIKNIASDSFGEPPF